MNLSDVLISTNLAHGGMTVGDIFNECVEKNVQGIPFQNEKGIIAGRISMRHIFREACLPKDIVNAAHMLGEQLTHLDIPDVDIYKMLNQSIEPFVIDNIPTLTSKSPLVKAIAIMEKFDSNYIFIFDGDTYKGVVTRFGIAQIFLAQKER